jgi:hypothetical protein
VQRELPPQAGAGPGSERFIDMGRQCADVLGQEPIGVEIAGVRPPRGVAVGGEQQDEYPLPRLEGVLAVSNCAVFLGLSEIPRRDRPQ